MGLKLVHVIEITATSIMPPINKRKSPEKSIKQAKLEKVNHELKDEISLLQNELKRQKEEYE